MFRKLRILGQMAMAACVLSGWTAAGAAGAQSACSDLGGTVDTSQICQVQSAASSYKIHFKFPVDYPDQQPVADYLTQERDGFIKFSSCRPPRLSADHTSWWPKEQRTDRRPPVPKAWCCGWPRTRNPTRWPGTRRSTTT